MAGYKVTEVDGVYDEDKPPHEKRTTLPGGPFEDFYFVLNWHSDPNFLKNLESFAQWFCQDSVFLKPLGREGYLLGTNNATYPGLGNKDPKSSAMYGHAGKFHAKVGDRLLTYENFSSFEALNNVSKGTADREGRPILDALGIEFKRWKR